MMNTSIQPTAKQYSYNEVVALFNDYIVDGIIKILECPKDIKLPKAVFDEVECQLEELEEQQFVLSKIVAEQTDKGTLFEVDVEDGEVYFVASDRVNNTVVEFRNIVAMLQPFGMKFQDVLEEEWKAARSLPLEEKVKFFNHCWKQYLRPPLGGLFFPCQTSQSSSMDTSTLKVQALLEIFWTPSPATLWYDAEFLELSTDLQQAIINELMDWPTNIGGVTDTVSSYEQCQ